MLWGTGLVIEWSSDVCSSDLAEAPLDLEEGGSRDDDLPDRRRVVEHVAVLRPQRRQVDLLRARKRELFAGGEEDLDPDRRALAHQPRSEERRGGGEGACCGGRDW